MNYKLRIQLAGVSSPEVWREIILPEGLTFEQLHLIIQAAFGWEDSHLYAFCENGLGDLITINCPVDADAFVTADKTYVDKLLVNLYNRREIRQQTVPFYYIYDYGDEWKHLIEVEEVDHTASPNLALLAGRGACPPEDCGGPIIYNALKNNPQLSEDTALPIGFNPDVVDVEGIKARLRALERRFIS